MPHISPLGNGTLGDGYINSWTNQYFDLKGRRNVVHAMAVHKIKVVTLLGRTAFRMGYLRVAMSGVRLLQEMSSSLANQALLLLRSALTSV